MKKLLFASVLGLATLGATPVFAAGAFDFLDPCIKARNEFFDQRQQVREKYAAANVSVDGMTYTPEFKNAWIKAKREQARPIFDKEVAPVLARYKVTEMDAAFNAWFDDMLGSIAPADLDSIINITFRQLAKEEIAQYQAKTESDYDKAKGELDSSCKKDVGSQVLRVATAPIGWIGGNFEAAKDEHNLVTQVFKAVTGISPKDIAKYGILGGENSELRKLANAIAGGEQGEFRKALRFMDPSNEKGIFGGHNSFFRKPFG
jgi:hypothetical protein